MKLHPLGREFYSLTVTTEPAVAAWEASFDGGETWVAGESAGAAFRWLVAGPDATPGDATVLAGSVAPIVRATDDPEVIVRRAPTIYVTATA